MTTTDINTHTLYGEYNWDDPIYRVMRRESFSPRFKVFMMQKGMKNLLFYQYTDFLAIQPRDGTDFDDLMRKQRRMLVDEGVVTEPNEAMRKNFEEYHIPYPDLEEADFRYGPVWCG